MNSARRILIALSLVAWLAIESAVTRAQEVPREGLILWLDASDRNTLAPGAPDALAREQVPAAVSTARRRPDVSDHERGEIDARHAAESSVQAGPTEPTVQGKGSTRNYQTIQAVWEPHAPAATHVLRRGDDLSPGLEVGPALPRILCESLTEAPLAATAAGSPNGRRLALAQLCHILLNTSKFLSVR